MLNDISEEPTASGIRVVSPRIDDVGSKLLWNVGEHCQTARWDIPKAAIFLLVAVRTSKQTLYSRLYYDRFETEVFTHASVLGM